MLGICGVVTVVGIATGRVSGDTSGVGPGALAVVAVGFGAAWFTKPKQ